MSNNDSLDAPAADRTSLAPYGVIIGGVLVALSFLLTLSQDGKPLIMFSEETVMIGAVMAFAACAAVFFGPRRPVGRVVVLVLAVLAFVMAAYYIAAYEQAVSELQRELSNW